MKIVALVSGGKDSTLNLIKCIRDGHEIVALANLYPINDTGSDDDEIDSYMYQTVGHEAIKYYAEAIDIPLFRRAIKGKPLNQSYDYEVNSEDEVEDLYMLLKEIRETHKIEFDGISVGAIMSNYQRIRCESVCKRLSLEMLTYLWMKDQNKLLKEMIDVGINAIIVKTAAMGLEPYKHLGLRLDEIYDDLIDLNKKYGINICGEGGEYESLTLDCPLFVKKLVIDDFDIVIHSNDAFAPVGHLKPKKITLVDKIPNEK